MRHDDAHNSVKVNVGDGHNLVYATQAYRFDNRFAVKYFAALEAANTDARTWLDTNYPCWEDPSAYWD